MRKATANFLLEGVTMATLAGLIFTGFIMEFTLPAGSGQRTVQWGLTRHDWGEVHFWLSIAFIVFLLAHLVLHWRWVWAMARGTDPKKQKARAAAFLIVTALLVVACALPWLIPVRPGPGGPEVDGGWGEGRGRAAREAGERPAPAGGEAHDEADERIKGYTTVAEAAALTGLTVEEISSILGAAGRLDGSERLGRLSRDLGLTMSEARLRIEEKATK